MNIRSLFKGVGLTALVASCALLTSCGKNYPDITANAIKADITQSGNSTFIIELDGPEFPERMGIAVERGGIVGATVEIEPTPGPIKLKGTNEVAIMGDEAKAGETIPVRLIDLTRNREISKLMVYPKPLEVTNGTMRLTATAPLADGQLWDLKASGFEPRESVMSRSVSAGERIGPHSSEMDKNGSRSVLVLPGVIGETGGICTYTITCARGSISIDLPWGTEYQELCYGSLQVSPMALAQEPDPQTPGQSAPPASVGAAQHS